MGLHWTITRKLQAMAALLLLLLIATSGFGIMGMSRMHDGFRSVTEDTTWALIHLSGTVDSLHRIRVRLIGATIETDSARLAVLRDEYAKQQADLNATWKAYAASPLSLEEAALARDADAGIRGYQAFMQESWDRIGEVVTLINDIAAQTNLLALNATIGRIDEISAAIASAVEQQGAATREIARNVEEAAQGTQSVSDNIAGVTSAARETGQASTTVLASARELAAQSQTLRKIVGDFVEKVRVS
jgi:hypothetical protein